MRANDEVMARYELYYWPFIPGRGELVRLVFEAAGVPYDDVARLPEPAGGGVAALKRFLAGHEEGALPFAPPFLRHGGLVLAQTAAICDYVASRHGLAPADPAGRALALQHALTVADLITEAHETHHPIAVSAYYEEQAVEAKKRAAAFVDQRLPRFLGYFERVLERSADDEGPRLVGAGLTYADLSLFQALEGLAYAFPRAFARVSDRTPLVRALRERVRGHERVAAYLASERRLPFNQHGIFRHYPELDG
jgi:glutathione S-transferase